MTRALPTAVPWAWGAALAIVVGAAAGAAGAWALAGVAGLGLALALVRARQRSAWVVAGFWVLFCTYETVLSDVLYVPGLFYPFYAAFVATILVMLLRSRLVLAPPLLWLNAAFLVVVLASFAGFTEPIGFEVLQRIVAYLVGPLVALQFAGRRALRIVQGAAVVSGVVLAAWVVFESIQTGFVYRGGVEVDQNVVSFFIGLGLIVAIADALAPTQGVRRGWAVAGTWLAAVLMLYGVLLLASRGIAIAIVIAVLAVVGRSAARKPARLVALVVAVAAVYGATFLPGGDGLLERFTEDTVTSGNDRIPIWIGALRYYAAGDLWQLLFGHGFASSWFAVQRVFGSLTSTHNAFLQLLVEFGIVGLGSFLALHAVLAWRSFQVEERLGSSMFGLLAFLLGTNLTLNATDGFMYWTALGLVMAMATWAPPAEPAPTAPRLAGSTDAVASAREAPA
ncbi:MAG: O-antigen ligase family protein [Trueperaceae bacterium]